MLTDDGALLLHPIVPMDLGGWSWEEISNVDSVIAGFEQMQLTEEFDYADKKTEKLPSWLAPGYYPEGDDVLKKLIASGMMGGAEPQRMQETGGMSLKINLEWRNVHSGRRSCPSAPCHGRKGVLHLVMNP